MQVRSHSKCRKRSVYMPSHSPAKKTEPVHIFFSNQAAAKLMLHIQFSMPVLLNRMTSTLLI